MAQYKSAAARNQCIVHQFLENQQRVNEATTKKFKAHPFYANADGQNDVGAIAEAGSDEEADEKARADSLRRGKRRSRAIFDPTSIDDDEIGQVDQRGWAEEMLKSPSEVDLASRSRQQQSADLESTRTYTKKQLSDMAWGVRELSRRLSSMRIRFRVKSILILTKIYDIDLIPKTRELAAWLLDSHRDTQFVVYVQDKLQSSKKFDADGLIEGIAKKQAGPDASVAARDEARDRLTKRLRYWDEDMCRERPHMFDFVITLGGDGTVLYASWLFQRIVPPVLSFSLGSLGFLTKFDFDDFRPTLLSAFNKGVTVSLRLRFESTIMRSIRRKKTSSGDGDGTAADSTDEEEEEASHRRRDLVEELIGEEREGCHTHQPEGTYEILNEVVVDRGPNPTMSYTEVFGDDEHFTSVLADGICVSTPTGSTAYNLAAGGSLCHPENPVMLVTSVCAHTLSFRPIILPDTIVLRVGVPYDARTASWASFDGRERVELKPGDYVTISASRYPFASVQMEGKRSEDWVNSISGKLGWNTRQKQRGYREWDS